MRIQCLYRRPRQVFLVLLVIAAAACTTQPDYTGTVNSDDEPFISGTYAGIREPSATPVFKVTDEATLTIEIRIPEGLEEQSAPTVVFFFGGGWTRGNQSHFRRQAEYLTSIGLVTALADYRVANRHQTTPAEALEDAKSAIRWLRANADEYKIDPDRLVGAGGSAGGHLAAAASVIEGFNAAEDDLSIPARPNALILWNPVIDNGPSGYGYDRVQEYWREFSPFHNIGESHPPTLFILGSEDKLLSVERGQQYVDKVRATGAFAVYRVYEGQRHGFFNNHKYYAETLLDAHQFLIDIGYTDAPLPSLTEEEKAAIDAEAAASFDYE